MYFLIEDDELLKKCNTISENDSADIKKEFNRKPVYNKIFLNTKKIFYVEKATDFHIKEIPKAGSNQTCLTIITIDSALIKDEN